MSLQLRAPGALPQAMGRIRPARGARRKAVDQSFAGALPARKEESSASFCRVNRRTVIGGLSQRQHRFLFATGHIPSGRKTRVAMMMESESASR